jgi:CRISPR-associated protein Cmr2
MEYLFLVTIGPVQDFIASARRTRDLAFGSWFLSELSRAAAYEIARKNGRESLIFPSPTSSEELEAGNLALPVANKIIARVGQEPKLLGLAVRVAVMERLHAIQEAAYSEVRFPGKVSDAVAQQIDDLPEVLWVALPCGQEPYQQIRKRLEVLMAARKNTRDFSPVIWGGFVPKSSIGGQLECVIPAGAYPSVYDPEEKKRAKIADLYQRYGAGPAERLSAVDLLKRRGVSTSFGKQFPSTSHMATSPFLQRLKPPSFPSPYLDEAKKAWQTYINKLTGLAFSPNLEHTPELHPLFGDYDGSLLFEGRLVDLLYAPGEDMNKSGRPQTAKQALQTFYQALDKQCKAAGLGEARPTPYYAFLQADGDGMGEIIDAQAAQGDDRHREVSRQLAIFASLAKNIVTNNRGTLIYAGGDDVVAFLPVDTVLVCARELAKTFQETLQGFSGPSGQEPSLSAGVAIVHHLESLYQVRKLAHDAEQRAKRGKKKALCITLSKRSGEDYHIVGQWDDLGSWMHQLIDICRHDAIPTGTAYELRDLLLRFSRSPDEAQAQVDNPYAEVIKVDALRIIKRKLSLLRGKLQPEQTAQIERMFIARLGMESEAHPDTEKIQPVLLGECIHELIIAQFLADAQDLAGLKKEEIPV